MWWFKSKEQTPITPASMLELANSFDGSNKTKASVDRNIGRVLNYIRDCAKGGNKRIELVWREYPFTTVGKEVYHAIAHELEKTGWTVKITMYGYVVVLEE